VRAFSHGCVRVENPRELAVRVLGWDRSEVDDAIASGENRTVNLPAKIPVHLTYFTTWTDSSGKLVYLPDIYGRDKRLESALNRTAVAAN
jgi:murein L,D-transpeptidase YcbB/YkuD